MKTFLSMLLFYLLRCTWSKPITLGGIFSRQSSKTNSTELTYFGLMLAGAIARSVSATAVHPLNVVKTMLQKKNGRIPDLNFRTLSRGAGSQFIMSVPHGAFNFAVTETTKEQLLAITHALSLDKRVSMRFLTPILDFASSSVSTLVCSIVSTPQMVITDRIMAGLYTDFISAVVAIYKNDGIGGFYLGWLPALAQKIPSYAMTWMIIQQAKLAFVSLMGRAATALENLLLGSLASAVACCIMIPVDTVKTRIVMQGRSGQYTGMLQCFQSILREEGVWSLYRALPPRLMSVVPMIGIQFAVYELVTRLLLHQPPPKLLKQQLSKLKAKQHVTTFASVSKK